MYKNITLDNLEHEHVCCSISGKDTGLMLKKEWLKERIKEGLVFRKLDERAKIFIEYLPSESAFAPVEAPNYMYINCFWVSGKFKKLGHGKALLDHCIEDAKEKGKSGVVVLSSKKKMPFLSDPKYLKSYGFKTADKALDYELLYLTFDDSKPKFKSCVGQATGHVLYYSNQCPHTHKYVKLVKKIAEELEFPLEIIHIQTKEEAQNAPCPFTTYSLYLNGQFVTNEILTEKKFLELIKPLI